MALKELFDRAEAGIKKDLLSGAEKTRALAKLAALRAKYEALGPIDEEGGVALGLAEKGKKLLGTSPLKPEALNMFIRYANAAWYDLSGNLAPYAWYVRSFFAATIGFFVLSPQFYPPILALIFIVPVFLGLRGLKARSINGFTMSAMIFPMALLAGSTAAKYYVLALFGRLAETAAELATNYRVPEGVAIFMVVLFGALSIVTIAASLIGAIVGFKNRDLFI